MLHYIYENALKSDLSSLGLKRLSAFLALMLAVMVLTAACKYRALEPKASINPTPYYPEP